MDELDNLSNTASVQTNFNLLKSQEKKKNPKMSSLSDWWSIVIFSLKLIKTNKEQM